MRRVRAAAPLLALLASSCTLSGGVPSPEPSGTSVSPPVAAAGAAEHGLPLPPGPGRAILEAACTSCHDLAGIAAYKGYYDGARWRALITTMVDYGADLEESQIALLTEYLVEHFGPGAR